MTLSILMGDAVAVALAVAVGIPVVCFASGVVAGGAAAVAQASASKAIATIAAQVRPVMLTFSA
ncbi:MAG TPA: hypothetical protein VGS01_16010 [Candidatus Limnocylindria bacterium]|nr:hypothetical protein [Candidatus Limnocylindria bacterium]